MRTRRTAGPAASAPAVDLVNNTGSDTVYAYVTGQAVDNGNALVLLEADGQTPYYPSSPSATGTPLAAGCSIPLNASGGAATPVTGSAGSGIDSQWQYETGLGTSSGTGEIETRTNATGNVHLDGELGMTILSCGSNWTSGCSQRGVLLGAVTPGLPWPERQAHVYTEGSIE